jgi:hypothetical protein
MCHCNSNTSEEQRGKEIAHYDLVSITILNFAARATITENRRFSIRQGEKIGEGKVRRTGMQEKEGTSTEARIAEENIPSEKHCNSSNLHFFCLLH